MFGNSRVRCRRPTGRRTTLRARELPEGRVALTDAEGATIAVLEPLQVGQLRGELRDAAVRALWPPNHGEWDGREQSIGWPFP